MRSPRPARLLFSPAGPVCLRASKRRGAARRSLQAGPSRNGTVSLDAQDADHSMITRDLEVRDHTGRAQHSADDGLHDNDVGLPSLMNIHLPAPAQRAHTYCCNGDCVLTTRQ